MGKIHVLDKKTCDQIAAGEVVERPMSVVKELVENAIDAGATAISVETKNGGIDYIRVTDNGSGIEKDDIPTAFLTHATSKIREISDLDSVVTMGFRGEALSSIASVSEMELITMPEGGDIGTSYKLQGGQFVSEEEIGAPKGTTMIVENLFFNTPARRKFLKTPMTENSYVGDLMERFALSHPDIRFKWVSNGSIRISTQGSGQTKDLIYSIYGRDTANEVTAISFEKEDFKVSGFIGKPVLSKGNRSFETYFVNGRYVKSKIIDTAIEDAYKPFMMQHRYPFTVLYIEMSPSSYDVNVHPTKMELRFEKEPLVYDLIKQAVESGLVHKEFISEIPLEEKKPEEKAKIYEAPEPFETQRIEKESGKTYQTPVKPVSKVSEEKQEWSKPAATDSPLTVTEEKPKTAFGEQETVYEGAKAGTSFEDLQSQANREPSAEKQSQVNDATPVSQQGKNVTAQPVQTPADSKPAESKPAEQISFPETFMTRVEEKKYRLIGQLFKTYWLIEMDDALFILDQHAAHEKVLFERKMKAFREKKIATQYITPRIAFTVTEQEEVVLQRFAENFTELGYEIDYFGPKEYALSGVPQDLFGLDHKAVFIDVLQGLASEYQQVTPETVYDKIASMSCKAAVKGNDFMTDKEAEALLKELLTLDNPYACPHGRPTLISITKTELEKKFKRIV